MRGHEPTQSWNLSAPRCCSSRLAATSGCLPAGLKVARNLSACVSWSVPEPERSTQARRSRKAWPPEHRQSTDRHAQEDTHLGLVHFACTTRTALTYRTADHSFPSHLNHLNFPYLPFVSHLGGSQSSSSSRCVSLVPPSRPVWLPPPLSCPPRPRRRPTSSFSVRLTSPITSPKRYVLDHARQSSLDHVVPPFGPSHGHYLLTS